MASTLNNKQKEFVTVSPGPLIAIAGPGTGKTHCLIEKIKFNKGRKILALTFTNKAAEEIRERLGKQNAVVVHTFHSFCLDVLKKHLSFEIIPDYQKLEIGQKLKQKYSLSKTPKQILYEIPKLKNSNKKNKLLQEYNRYLHKNNYLDWDDLIERTIQLDKKLIPAFDLILIDEFQDTNPKQFDLLNHIAINNNITVIGDPNQSIYSFRGADSGIFVVFKKTFPNFTEIVFRVNYRSTASLVNLANNIFPKYEIKSANKNKGELNLVKSPTKLSEAKFIFNTINEKVGGVDILKASDYSGSHADCHFKDFAVIYRKHIDGKFIRKILDEEGLPLQQVGEDSPFNSFKAQKMLSYMKNNSVDYAKASSVLGYVVPEISELNERFSNKPLSQLLEYIEKISDIGFYDYLGDKITLCTIHAAKGLEFKYVFIPQFNLINYPQKGSVENEELRLFYVAVTRAKYGLYLMQVGKRSKFARYLTNLATRIRDEKGYRSLDRAKIKKLKKAQTSLF